MHIQARCRVALALPILVTAALAGCSSLNGAAHNVASMVTPYKVEVVQGNFVSSEQVEALQPNMSRQQVRDILGTPLVTSVFHGDRWEYIFTIKRAGLEPQVRKLTVFFEGDLFTRSEGDEMPSEAEFVASLGSKKSQGKVPVLEATDAQLSRFPAPQPEELAQPEPPPAATSYPPLESGAY
ncbi:outer membrane protein assembly factor BamE [Comamonas composti]|uniref:outer membrane protein assembly factor BamE n=1 Tax=Comamonas composti TaxID=408558 RepID=UPI0004189012|nr:outer membrane protein assembly factor BamE [Comamonas composti]